MIMNNLIKITERNIFFHILEISDIEFQKRAWFGQYKNYISSYSELMCRLFDDDKYTLFINQYAKSLGYSFSFIKKLNALELKLNSFNKNELLSDLEIINDSYWHKISDMAKTIIQGWPHLAEIINNVVMFDSPVPAESVIQQ